MTDSGLDATVLKIQRDNLRDALVKVLDVHKLVARTCMSYENANENYSNSDPERKAHELAMLAASDAEREARVLLLTMKEKSSRIDLVNVIDKVLMESTALGGSTITYLSEKLADAITSKM